MKKNFILKPNIALLIILGIFLGISIVFLVNTEYLTSDNFKKGRVKESNSVNKISNRSRDKEIKGVNNIKTERELRISENGANIRRREESRDENKNIELTDEEKEEVNKIMKKYEPEIKPMLEQVNELAREIESLMASNDLSNEEKIREKHNQLLKIESELKKLEFNLILELRRLMYK